jgi:fumarate reductase flavoprotein subunit
VFGAKAGRNAAQWAREHPDIDTASLEKQAEDEQRRIATAFINKQGGTERIATLRTELQAATEAGCGIYRDDASLREAAHKVAELKERFSRINLDDHTLSFNTELTTALELEFMIDIAEALVEAALERKESRGSHQRTDFPERDDERYLKHSLAFRTADRPRIEYRDVVITNWPPAVRVYGRQH